MPNNKMLIDATHPEETRIVVLRDGRVEEFDYESAARKLLRGNIYLAKVTRVEPSLQAAFVDYGGNRHGFLAFSEIHPDYYQIPVADRQALLEEEAAAEAAEEAAADAHAERLALRRAVRNEPYDTFHAGDNETIEPPYKEDTANEANNEVLEPEAQSIDFISAPNDISGEESSGSEIPEPEIVGEYHPDANLQESIVDQGDLESEDLITNTRQSDQDTPKAIGLVENQVVEVVPETATEPEMVEQSGTSDALEELPSRQRRRPRSYKIQEVIKRRQVILVQVVKEERGNKGAALTTYLSLAGRYTVLMPNTARGGGISRKINNPQDRKRLKAIAAELDVPEGMGLIIRTAGAARTKQEIKRDYEYLLRLWESVRDLTLKSTAPCLVYEEGNLIKRSIRDLYNKDVDEIIVSGETAHEEAKSFMGMLMPSHAKNVLLHSSSEPLFNKYGIERQLNAMFSPYVNLRSGGYIVINQTEALVAIDVNSGRSTREFSIEETAYNTNLEAADEIARQLKLRDLAGLIVIDFIDMEENRNNRAVERRLKEALRFDRARIQLGRISHFGLMEMSRQRLRAGVLEGSTSQCPHCQGTGIIRSTESVALAVLRSIEDNLMSGPTSSLIANTSAQVALYILNNKRSFITDLESRHGTSITVQANDRLQGANFTIERGAGGTDTPRSFDRSAVNMDWGFTENDTSLESGDEVFNASSTVSEPPYTEDRTRKEDMVSNYNQANRYRRGRRGRWQNRRGDSRYQSQSEPFSSNKDDFASSEPLEDQFNSKEAEQHTSELEGANSNEWSSNSEDNMGLNEEDQTNRNRRRGRRGGRRGRGRFRDNPETYSNQTSQNDEYPIIKHVDEHVVDDFAGAVSEKKIEKKKSHQPEHDETLTPNEMRAESWSPDNTSLSNEDMDTQSQKAAETLHVSPKPPASRKRSREPISSEPRIEHVVVNTDQEAPEKAPEERPSRRGWWQKRIS